MRIKGNRALRLGFRFPVFIISFFILVFFLKTFFGGYLFAQGVQEQPRFYTFGFFQFDGDLKEIVQKCGDSVDKYGRILNAQGIHITSGKINVPISVAEESIYPKPNDKLFMFCHSKLIAKTKAKKYQISENEISGDLIPSFEIDRSAIMKHSGSEFGSLVFISVPPNVPAAQLPREINFRTISKENITNLLLRLDKGEGESFHKLVEKNISPKAARSLPRITSSWTENTKTVSSISLPDEKISFLNLELPCSNGSYNYNKKILICSVGERMFVSENYSCEQVFKVMNHSYVVLFSNLTGETGGTGEFIYRITKDGFIEVSTAGISDD
jgi:hypothetical protein